MPIIIMAYLDGEHLDFDNLAQPRRCSSTTADLADGGAQCSSLMHWVCSTTRLTIRKETQSWKWTAVSSSCYGDRHDRLLPRRGRPGCSGYMTKSVPHSRRHRSLTKPRRTSQEA
ncbi:MAG: hypothetical protein ACLVL7_09135 [Anaerotruncus massiliensis (ex Togo et al. 2019)]